MNENEGIARQRREMSASFYQSANWIAKEVLKHFNIGLTSAFEDKYLKGKRRLKNKLIECLSEVNNWCDKQVQRLRLDWIF
jgi:hypothetical protein